MYKAFSAGTIGHSVPLEVTAPVAAAHGWEGLWLDIKKDASDPNRAGELLAQHNLRAAGFSLPVDFRGGQEGFEKGLEALTLDVENARVLGMTRCATYVMPFSDSLDYKRNFELHVKRLHRVVEILKKADIRLGLEFVGTPGLRTGKAHPFIYNLEQMLTLCEAIDSEYTGLLLDVWHWDMAGHTKDDFRLLTDEKQIVLVHINDAPADVARDQQQDTVRTLPGATGVLNIDSFFEGLQTLGYTGPVVAEPFDSTLADMSFEQATTKLTEAVNAIWPKR